jgi:hypothetical protein
MSSKMSMMFSQKGVMPGKIMRRVAPVPVSAPAPAPATVHATVPATQQARVRDVVVLKTTARSTPVGIKQLFNLGHIMANPGTPCKACGS